MTTNISFQKINTNSLFECPICIDFLNQPVTLPCGHNFCKTCIKKSFSLKMTCPICREEVTRDYINNLSINTQLLNIIDAYKSIYNNNDYNENEKEMKKEVLRMRLYDISMTLSNMNKTYIPRKRNSLHVENEYLNMNMNMNVTNKGINNNQYNNINSNRIMYDNMNNTNQNININCFLNDFEGFINSSILSINK